MHIPSELKMICYGLVAVAVVVLLMMRMVSLILIYVQS